MVLLPSSRIIQLNPKYAAAVCTLILDFFFNVEGLVNLVKYGPVSPVTLWPPVKHSKAQTRVVNLHYSSKNMFVRTYGWYLVLSYQFKVW